MDTLSYTHMACSSSSPPLCTVLHILYEPNRQAGRLMLYLATGKSQCPVLISLSLTLLPDSVATPGATHRGPGSPDSTHWTLSRKAVYYVGWGRPFDSLRWAFWIIEIWVMPQWGSTENISTGMSARTKHTFACTNTYNTLVTSFIYLPAYTGCT